MIELDYVGLGDALLELRDALPERWTLGSLDQEPGRLGGPWRARADGQRGARLVGANSPTMADAVRSLTERVRREFTR